MNTKINSSISTRLLIQIWIWHIKSTCTIEILSKAQAFIELDLFQRRGCAFIGGYFIRKRQEAGHDSPGVTHLSFKDCVV